jgi:hypothetical protein
MNVTDTASAAASLLLDLQVGGASRFNVLKSGVARASSEFQAPSVWATTQLYVGAGADIILTRDAANTLAQRNGTAAQAFRIYNTFTDASNYERGLVGWVGNAFNIRTQAAGSGTPRQLNLGTDSSSASIQFITNNIDRWNVSGAGHFLANADNTYDIGASGANRPRNLYIAGFATFGGAITMNTGNLTIAASSAILWGNGTNFQAPADGVITAYNNGNTNFNRLQLGGTTNSFGAIARDGAGVSIVGGAGGSTAHIKVPGVTVANLPAAATAGAGARSFVTDATAPVFGSAVVGGGAVPVPVYSTGAAWNVG